MQNLNKYSERLKSYLFEYSFTKQQAAENSMTQMLNNIKTFRFDELDILELLLSFNEYEVTNRICDDIRTILKFMK